MAWLSLVAILIVSALPMLLCWLFCYTAAAPIPGMVPGPGSMSRPLSALSRPWVPCGRERPPEVLLPASPKDELAPPGHRLPVSVTPDRGSGMTSTKKLAFFLGCPQGRDWHG
jgi:hypothetical protein